MRMAGMSENRKTENPAAARPPRHVFVVCAYGKCRYLDACIRSLKSQTVKSDVILVTSTPNAEIRDTARRYGLLLYTHEKSRGIADDWAFALRTGREKADYVTLAHQDDIYLPHYTECVLKHAAEAPDTLIAFSDYAEIRAGRVRDKGMFLFAKRLMLLPLRSLRLRASAAVRRRILSFGDPICCPSVLYCDGNLPDQLFRDGFQSCLDWDVWERLSGQKGSFVYVPHVLVLHRIHKETATFAQIRIRERRQEDLAMFRRFWPAPMARLLARLYAAGEKNYLE